MKALYLLLLSVSLYAQHFTETFDSFIGDTTLSGSIANYILDDTNFNRLNDYSPNTNTLTRTGTDSVLQISPVFSGGYSQYFNGSDAYFNTASSVIGATDFTAIVFYKSSATGVGNMRFLSEDNLSARDFTLFFAGAAADKMRNLIFISNAGKTHISTSSGEGTWFDNAWHRITATHDGSNLRIYWDNVEEGSGTSAIGTVDNDGDEMYLGVFGQASKSEYYEGYMSNIRIYSRVLTTQERAEAGYLADGWTSYAGGITRGAGFAFNQGIEGSGITITTNSGNTGTTTLTSSSETYTILLGSNNLSSDSLKITTDTETIAHAISDYTFAGDQLSLQIDAWETGGVVYVDNIVLSIVAAGNDPGFDGWGKYKQFNKYD